jgi:hypothetical protein
MVSGAPAVSAQGGGIPGPDSRCRSKRWWSGLPFAGRRQAGPVPHLVPGLGRIRLAELTGRDVAVLFTALSETPARHGRPLTPSSLHRIRATLRAALNAAIREGLLQDNPARHIEQRTPRRPPAQVWTAPRVKAWRERGERSTEAVWTEHQLAEFLHYVAVDRLYAMWWLIAPRGLRRGDAAGPPKTVASRRTIALDRITITVIRAHRRRQEKERAAAGQVWKDTGYVV